MNSLTQRNNVCLDNFKRLTWSLINCRSIKNKLSELHYLLNTSSIDILLLTETWLNRDMPDSVLVPNGTYRIFRHDRAITGGGVAILVKTDLSAKIVTLETVYEHLEIVAVDLKLDKVQYRVICFYRPPGMNDTDLQYFSDAVKCFQKLTSTHEETVIVGDFNLPKIDWECYCSPDTPIYNVFMNFINNYGFYQHVFEPTRDNNILDLVLSTSDSFISELEVSAPFSTSDHNTVTFCTNVLYSNELLSVEMYYDFLTADYAGLKAYLSEVKWNDIFQYCFSINACCDAFYNILCDGIERFVSKRVSKDSADYKTKRYPRYIMKLVSSKRFLWRKWKRFKNQNDLNLYNETAENCRTAIKKFHAAQELKLIRKNNLGSFYRFINRKLHSKNSQDIFLKKCDGSLTNNPKEKAELFNNYFSSVFTVDDGCLPEFVDRVDESTRLFDVDFTPEIVFKVLHKLKPSTSHGPDGIPNLLLKNLARELSVPLCHLFDFSFKSQKLPDCWKLATVTPIFKQGETSNPNNYRPISLTSNCCKAMERIINDSLLKYLMHNSLITAHQHAFMKSRSTCGNILECLEDWVMNLESKRITDVVYIDFKKAFDTVCHAKLVLKLRAYGISGNVIGWITSFLCGRSQCVKIGSALSSYISILSGVPQGSVLGPILFLLYINDVVECFNNLSVCTKLFADDLKLYSSYSAMSTSFDLQQALDSVSLVN